MGLDAETLKYAAEFGVLAAVLLSVVTSVAWFCRAVWNRLFDEERGIVTRITNRHIQFIDALESSQQKTVEILQRQEDHLSLLVAQHADPKSTFSTVRTNRCLWYLAEALKALAHGSAEHVEQNIEKAKEALEIRP